MTQTVRKAWNEALAIGMTYTQRERHVRQRVAGLVLLACLLPLSAASAKDKSSSLPPVKFWPLSRIEPSRDVAATQWKSPYCTQWHDGCQICRRSAWNKPVKCEAHAGADPKTCERQLIQCNEVDEPRFRHVCQDRGGTFLSTESIEKLRRGGKLTGRTNYGVMHSWKKEKGKNWEFDTMAELTLPMQPEDFMQSMYKNVRGNVRTHFCVIGYKKSDYK